MINFASENYDKTHPAILKSIAKYNAGFAPSYGKDENTNAVIEKLKNVFDTNNLEVFFCFNGTGANNFALSSITEKYSSILCSDVSHLYTAESTAPETFTGCRLYTVKTLHGKIVIADFLQKARMSNDVHLPQASVLSITQPTEYGTVYTLQELKTIGEHCRKNNILLHIDGARIFNAVVSLNCSLAELIKISGADVITLGGTKNGLMFGEAVVFFKTKRFKNISYNHKRSMQLASKNRYIAIQFNAILKDNLGLTIASYTNDLAKYFEQEITKINNKAIAYPIQTNMVFLKMKQELYDKLTTSINFYYWDKDLQEARIAFSFSNTKEEINYFIKTYKKAMKEML